MRTFTIFALLVLVLLGTSPNNRAANPDELEQRMTSLEGRVSAIEGKLTQFEVADAQRQEKLEACIDQANKAFENRQKGEATVGSDGRMYLPDDAMKDATEFWRIKLETCRTLYGRGPQTGSSIP